MHHDARELTEAEEEYMGSDEPADSTLVPTGLTGDRGATHLEVHHWGGNTLVGPMGEEQNGDDWAFDGIVSPEDVLTLYLRSVHE